ncbi:MAG: hypothetical protein QHH75_01995 [Bacillota bacterium]|jgi:hypothetical protein|nr:hypothetical protein [Bacillota bacterium]
MGREIKRRKAKKGTPADREKGAGIKCSEARELFYNTGEEKLDPETAHILYVHETSCPDCHEAFTAWREIRSALRKAKVSPPPAFAAGVIARITQSGLEGPAQGEESGAGAARRKAKGFRWNWPNWSKGVAAAAVILALLTGSASFAGKYWPGKAGSYIAEREGKQGGEREREIKKLPGQRENETGVVVPVEPGTEGPTPDLNPPGSTPEEEEQPELSGQTPPVKEPDKPAVVATNKPPDVRTFLSKPRTIKTTMLKVAVADLERARSGSLEIARSTGAKASPEVSAQNNGRKNIIIRFTLAPEKSGEFLDRLASLGEVILKDTTNQDVTASFTRTLEEYQTLKAQRAAAPESERPRLDGQINFLEQQLQSWDEEAEKQVVILWLEQ